MRAIKYLIKSLLNGDITATTFEEQFLQTLKKEGHTTNNQTLKILNDLKSAIICFDVNCRPEDELSVVISEKTLKSEAKATLDKLNGLRSVGEICPSCKEDKEPNQILCPGCYDAIVVPYYTGWSAVPAKPNGS